MDKQEKFTKHEFELPIQGDLTGFTSIVCAEAEFEDLCDEFSHQAQIMMIDKSSRMDAGDVDKFRSAKYIPLVQRGRLTQWLFDRYGVTTPLMAVVVRGHGPKMALEMSRRFSN